MSADRQCVAEQRHEVVAESDECSDNGTMAFYAVEIKASTKEPVVLDGVAIGHEWKRVSVSPAKYGISENSFYPWATQRGYLSYDVAMALAWSVQARAKATIFVGVSVRVIEVSSKWAISFKKTAEFDPIYWRGRPKFSDDTD